MENVARRQTAISGKAAEVVKGHLLYSGSLGGKGCSVCRADHQVAKCHQFAVLSLEELLQHVADNRLCKRCLRVNSYRHSCRPRSSNADGCVRRHHPLLHEA